MIQGSIQEEEITIITIYATNIGAAQYIRQTLADVKGETDRDTVTAGDLHAPLAPTSGPSSRKSAREHRP